MFPFERVPQGSRIVIYGAGVKGQSYLRQMLLTGYCTVVAMADQNYAGYQDCVVPVCAPEWIHTFTPDYVVIALRFSYYLDVFHSILAAQGIPEERIIYLPAREEVSIFAAKVADEALETKNALLLYQMGGFGDCIVQKKVVETLISLAPEVPIDITCTNGASFLKFLYEDTPQVRKIELNLGVRYAEEQEHYAAALCFVGLAWLQVDILQEEGRLPSKLYEVLKRLKERTDRQSYPLDMPMHSFYARCLYQGRDCYQHLSYDGIVPYHDHKVHIPSDAAGRQAFVALGLGRYITMNFGNGGAKDTTLVAKSWPKERFEAVIAGIHAGHPDVQIVQLGTVDADRLAGADRYLLGKSFSLASEVLRHAQLHIDIEGGLVHLATQLGTKCIVLFGPTQQGFYGYAENVNLHAGTCHNCYALYKDWNRCARNMAEPECMYSITPAMVLEAVEHQWNR